MRVLQTRIMKGVPNELDERGAKRGHVTEEEGEGGMAERERWVGMQHEHALGLAHGARTPRLPSSHHHFNVRPMRPFRGFQQFG